VWYDDTMGHVGQGPRFAFLKHDGPIAFAHRGGIAAGTGAAENTMAAFQRAVDMGFRYLETDVHATSDGVLLVFHDHRLKRLTGTAGRLTAQPYESLRRLRVASSYAIPRLEEVFAAFPDVRLNIDVKAANAIGPLLDVLQTTRSWDRVCVASFSDRRVRAVRSAAGPNLATALGPREVAALRLASHARGNRLDGIVVRGAACVQVPVRVGTMPVIDEALIATAHRLGLVVHAWVIDDANDITALLDRGVDGIMSDDLDALRTVFSERGYWPQTRGTA
jgi:glycerophosphoryl diester phosphodiesterase